MEQAIDIKSMTLPELMDYVSTLGEKPFRAKQLFSWLHEKRVKSYEEMTNLSKTFREKLDKEAPLITVTKEDCQISAEDGTRKYLFCMLDGAYVESVLMKYSYGNSVCISSQVGCRMGCKFCASTLDGLDRNLRPSEMLEQIYEIERDIKERISHVVIMGTGEPMDNFDNVLRFLDLIHDENGMNLSHRNITVSTCGIVPRIKELADKKLQITLAISLHAPNQEKRKALMPIANKYDITEVMEACRYYFASTGRRVSFEYSLIAGENDSDQDASELVALIKDLHAHVNLIPVNPIKERNFKESTKDAVFAFKNKLERNGINVTIRREMGRDIDGACGQLRRRYQQKAQPKGNYV